MPTYVVTREKDPKSISIRSIVKRLAPANFKQHPVVFRAPHGRQEVLEGAAFEEILILDFPGDEEAKAWYHSPEYQPRANPVSEAETTVSSSLTASHPNGWPPYRFTTAD